MKTTEKDGKLIIALEGRIVIPNEQVICGLYRSM